MSIIRFFYEFRIKEWHMRPTVRVRKIGMRTERERRRQIEAANVIEGKQLL